MFPGVYDTSGLYSQTLARGPLGIGDPEVFQLASDVDGAAIQVGLVRPRVPDDARTPVIIAPSPFYDPLTPERIRANPRSDGFAIWDFNHWQAVAERFVPHGYAVAFLAARGSAGSGGCGTDSSPAEAADLDQAVTWLGTRPWSNGNVGAVGMSYEGQMQWEMASFGNPHLKTIVPAVPSGPDRYASHYTNGTGTPWWLGDPTDTAGYALGLTDSGPTGRSAALTAQGAACPERWAEAAAEADAVARGDRHDPAGVWDARDYRARIEANYQGTVFLASGLRDPWDMTLVHPWLRTFEDRGGVVKQLLGQWDHAYPDKRVFAGQDETHKRWDFAELLLRWFDRWLKEDAAVDVGPRVQVQDTAGRWRDEAAWPPRDALAQRFALAAGAELTEAASATTGRSTLCPAEPAARPGPCEPTLELSTPPLARELRFAGEPTLHLTVTPHGPGGALEATLLSIEGEAARPIGFAWMDLRQADGTGFSSPVRAGETIVARMQYAPLDAVVPAGARLGLHLRQMPGGDAPGAAPVAPVDVAWGPEASILTLHAFERWPGAFFEPPGVGT